MLVLSRRAHETIVIDGQIEVTVISMKGGSVKLGVSAPDNVRIRRSELPSPGGLELVEPLANNESLVEYVPAVETANTVRTSPALRHC